MNLEFSISSVQSTGIASCLMPCVGSGYFYSLGLLFRIRCKTGLDTGWLFDFRGSGVVACHGT